MFRADFSPAILLQINFYSTLTRLNKITNQLRANFTYYVFF